MHILDSECSVEYKEAIKNNQMNQQLVPPNNRRRNIAENAIQEFKDHLILVLCGTAVDFPMQLWCQLLGQAKRKRTAQHALQIKDGSSGYQVLHGNHHYNINSFAFCPLGT